MRTLSRSRLYSLRATMRANRWPLPGLPSSGPTPATLDAMEDVRSLVASHGRTDESRAASASVSMLAATHGRSY